MDRARGSSAEATGENPPKSANESHILIVDDEKSIVELLCIVLEDEGFHVTGEVRISGAVRSIKDEHPDVILADVMMPGMTGPELADAALQMDPNIRVILMTAALDSNPDGRYPLLAKPFDLKTVVDMVNVQLHAS